jgi:hypothetical protein
MLDMGQFSGKSADRALLGTVGARDLLSNRRQRVRRSGDGIEMDAPASPEHRGGLAMLSQDHTHRRRTIVRIVAAGCS